MESVKIPYSKRFLEVDIPKKNLIGILESKVNTYKQDKTQKEIIECALDNPIESNKLEDLVRGKKDMVIITSDHTRPVPSRITMPILLRRIRKVNPKIDIKILIATGYHRGSTREELIHKFGKDIVENEKIINHDSRNEKDLVKVGILPSGGELWLNKLAVETELLIAEGFIEPHFFAGFSGGRKSVLPGVAGAQTVLANHCSEFIDSKYARTGNLQNNPIHKDMLFAAEQSNLAFILNVILNEDKEVIHAVAGHSGKSHQSGCDFLMELSKVDKKEADIVITSNGGYPLDQNIYQSVKGMTAGEATCKEGGVIIIASACNDGHGGQSFYENLANANSPDEVLDKVLEIPRNKTLPDQWEFQILARILSKYTVILVTDICDSEMIKSMHMQHASSLNEALDMAFDLQGKDAKIAAIPDGVSVIVK